MRQIIRTSTQLGQMLQGQRKSLVLTQVELGAMVGISQKRQSALELAPERITVERLLRLISALNLEIIIQDKNHDEPDPSQEW